MMDLFCTGAGPSAQFRPVESHQLVARIPADRAEKFRAEVDRCRLNPS